MSLLSYFLENDIVLNQGQVLNTVPEERDNYIYLRGISLGLEEGPLISDLENNLFLKTRCLKEMSEIIMMNKVKKDTSFYSSSHFDPLKSFALDVILQNSFVNVLRPKFKIVNVPDFDLSSFNPKINPYLKSCLNGVQISFKGSMYKMVPKNNPTKIGAYIDGQHYAISNSFSSIESVLKDYFKQVSSKIDSSLDSEIINAIETRIEKTKGIIEKKQYYDEKKNLGFVKKNIEGDEKFFIFTKTPEYILWEHVTDKYYCFPPAEVGVCISLDKKEQVFVSNPVIINKYKHPAISGINVECRNICFSNYVSQKSKPPRELATTLLYEGCKMLMQNYCSDGGAYYNIFNNSCANQFKDLEVFNPDISKITNRSACLQRRRFSYG